LALLMRKPEDRRCKAVVKPACEVFKLRCAFNDEILVLIMLDMLFLLGGSDEIRLKRFQLWFTLFIGPFKPLL
jgi:hypothetical protein